MLADEDITPARKREASMIYRIQGCLFNSSNRTLNKQGEVILLTPKLYRLLKLFIEADGQVVSKNSIRKHVWCGQLVCETTLYKLVQRLRCLMGDDGAEQTVIKTIHGEGYMLTSKLKKASFWSQMYLKIS
jgi:DNA-binding winged helix-turn-helix (wHTH) protein